MQTIQDRKELDVAFVRQQFPAFSEPSLEGQAFFENAGGSYACKQVIDRLYDFYTRLKVQPHHRYPVSQVAGREMDSSYPHFAAYLGVEPDEVYFGPSTTQNTYVLAQAFRDYLEAGDEIIVTNQDHEANSGAWRKLADYGVTVREWQVDAEGRLQLEDLRALLSEKTKIVAFPHCSNIVGEINPVGEIAELAHEVGAVAVVDGVSYAGHGFPDVAELGADIYLFSTYKTYGPHQGVMVVREATAQKLSNQGHYFNEGNTTKRLTPAGPDHAQIAAARGVTDYFDAVYGHHYGDVQAEVAVKAKAVHDLFRNAELARLGGLLEYLSAHPKVRIIGPKTLENRAPTVSLTVEGRSSAELVEALAERGVMCAYGHFYAARLLDALEIGGDGVLRLSFVHYTSEDEMAQLISALDETL